MYWAQHVTLLAQNSFHNKLKTNPAYLDNKANRRIDYLLTVLLKFEEDMFLIRQQKLLGMKTNYKVRKEGMRHQEGLRIPKEAVKVIEQTS